MATCLFHSTEITSFSTPNAKGRCLKVIFSH